jgi:hypothetical protein
MTQFFAIAFVGRSGSSYLQGLLDDHPDARCMGELFWDKSAGIAEILDRQVHSADHLTASGFKLGNMHIIEYPEARNILFDRNYSAIHLTRENRVDQYISMVLAMQNDSWRSDAGDYTTQEFEADPAHMEKFLGLMESHDVVIGEFLEGLQVLRMSYEELLRDGCGRALDFLGLRHVPLTSPFKRQRATNGQRQAILNYDQMALHFAGTRFAPHFTEV